MTLEELQTEVKETLTRHVSCGKEQEFWSNYHDTLMVRTYVCPNPAEHRWATQTDRLLKLCDGPGSRYVYRSQIENVLLDPATAVTG